MTWMHKPSHYSYDLNAQHPLSPTASNGSVSESKVTTIGRSWWHLDSYTYLCHCWGRVRDYVGPHQAYWGKKGWGTSHWRCHLGICSPQWRPACGPLVSHEYQSGSSIAPGGCLGRSFGGETEGGKDRGREGERESWGVGIKDVRQNLNTMSEDYCTNAIIVRNLTI